MSTDCLIKLSAAIALIFSALVPSHAQTGAGRSLSVSVADSLTSEPLAGAVVELLGEDMERDTYATTGEDGIAVLHGVEDGKYFIRLSLLGYESRTYSVEMTPDSPDALALAMPGSSHGDRGCRPHGTVPEVVPKRGYHHLQCGFIQGNPRCRYGIPCVQDAGNRHDGDRSQCARTGGAENHPGRQGFLRGRCGHSPQRSARLSSLRTWSRK